MTHFSVKVAKKAILIVVFKTINLMYFGALCEGKHVFYGLVRPNTLDAGFTILLNSGNISNIISAMSNRIEFVAPSLFH